MNREILFRGKRIDNGEWAEGCLLYSDDEYRIVTSMLSSGENEETVMAASHKVYGDTICQYTELRDDNGTKIFDGDILKLYDENNNYTWYAVVSFGNPNGEYVWGWNLVPIGEFNGNFDILLWIDMPRTVCEIIGNSHDNKKLISELQGDS